MKMDTEDLCVISYNSRGFDGSKKDFIKLLAAIGGCSTVICNQENFLLKNNEYMAKQILPGHHLFCKPAVKEGFDGRPKNGMFVAVPLNLREKTKDISPSSDRVQCVVIKDHLCSILILNTYFPTDPRKDDFDDTELQLVLSEISTLISDNPCDNVIWTGDINADFRRNSRFVDMVDDFVTDLGLHKAWDSYSADFTHVTEREGVTYTSVIDHFFWNHQHGTNVKEAGIIHLPENTSDHCPVFCRFARQCCKDEEKARKSHSTDEGKKPISWNKFTDLQKEDFVSEVGLSLQDIDLPSHCINCRNVHCQNADHRAKTDSLMAEVLGTLEDAAIKFGPDNKKKGSKPKVSYWKEEVEPLQEKARFWHAIWVSAGKPLNCALHNIMKKTRNQYHLLIRKKKRLADRINKEQMLHSCAQKDGSVFDAIRKKRRSTNTIATVIDNESDDIPGYLADKYEKLYNAVEDKSNMDEIEKELEEDIKQDDYHFISKISADTLIKAAKKLKPGKTDPVFGITSDYLIHSPRIVFELLAICLRSYMVHGYVSDHLMISTMIPLIKDKMGDQTSSDNYRSIAISSLVMKLYDLVIIKVFQEHLFFDDLQFGYQSDVSTSMCTWLATESISYFRRNGNDVFTCLMDMSKAFDTVQHSVLFRKLLKQGMPPIIVRYILVSYKGQKANVRWDKEHSRFFTIKNGVKQGAILSAVLYCVYTNELFLILRKRRIGCFIEDTYVGAVGYADDLLLMAPSLDGLQEMLKVCEKYAAEHNLKFSTDPNPRKSKTKCMAFLLKNRELRNLKLCGNELPWVNTGKHLGMRLDNGSDIFQRDILEKRARYIQGNNQLMQEFAFADCSTKIFINAVYNSHHYGSVLWDLYSREANMVYNTWNVSIRVMLRIDRKSHRYLIEPLSETPHLRRSLLSGFKSFVGKLENSPKKAVRSVFHLVKDDCRSITGSNIRNIALEFRKDPNRPLSDIDIKRKAIFQSPDDAVWRIPLIRELLGMRDGDGGMNIGWAKEEITDTVEYLCTS